MQDNAIQQNGSEIEQQSQRIIVHLSRQNIKSKEQRIELQKYIGKEFKESINKIQLFKDLIHKNNLPNIKGIVDEILTQELIENLDPDQNQNAIDIWQDIHIDYLDIYFKKFQINPQHIKQPEQRINQLILKKKLQDAMRLIYIFIDQIDILYYMEKFINQNYANEFQKVVQIRPQYAKNFTEFLCKNQAAYNQKLATEIIRKYQLNKNDFPQLIQLQNKQCVEKTYFPQVTEYEAFRAEERLSDCKFMLIHVFNRMVEHKLFDHAFSLAQRQNLDVKVEQGKYIENPLLQFDGFGATETICFNEPKEDYILFEEFGIKEEDIIFISKPEELENAFNQIFESKYIGFDSEFKHYYDEFDVGGVAIIQIAADKQIFIIDVVNLEKNEQFLYYITKLFNCDLVKIGHSVKNDVKELQYNIKFTEEVIPKNLIDLVDLYNEKIQKKQTSVSSVSLFNQTNNLLGKKLSKKECFSNWERRPLYKRQIHYAAMDAFICRVLFEKLNSENDQLQGQQYQNIKPNRQKQNRLIRVDENFKYDQDFEQIYKEKRIQKFVVDTMLKKLVSFLRNLGIDTEYMEVQDYNAINNLAAKEQRIIITRDKKFFHSDKFTAPCYLISSDGDTEDQYDEIANYFKFTKNDFNLLQRCVKCNHPEVQEMSSKEALQILNFKNVLLSIYYRDLRSRRSGSVKNVNKSIGKVINLKILIHDFNKKYKMNEKINELSKDFSQLKYDLFLGYDQKYRFYGLCVFTGLNITIAAFMKKNSKLIQTGLFSFLGYGFFIYPELYINLLLKEKPIEVDEIPHFFIKRD